MGTRGEPPRKKKGVALPQKNPQKKKSPRAKPLGFGFGSPENPLLGGETDPANDVWKRGDNFDHSGEAFVWGEKRFLLSGVEELAQENREETTFKSSKEKGNAIRTTVGIVVSAPILAREGKKKFAF